MGWKKENVDVEKVLEKSPEEDASIFSIVTLRYLNPLLKIGASEPLQEEHLYPVLPKVRAKEVSDKFQEVFYEKNTGILKSLYSLFKAELHFGAIWAFIYGVLPLVNPFILQQMINVLASQADDFEGEKEPLWIGILWCAALFFALLVNAVAMAQSRRLAGRFSVGVHSAIGTAMYKKALALSNKSIGETQVGKVVNLMAVDTDLVVEFTQQIQDTWVVILQVIAATGILYYFLEEYAFVGIAVELFLMPVMVVIVIVTAKYQKKKAATSDVRLKATTDALQGIRAIKAYAWEEYFIKKINGLRDHELTALGKTFLWQGWLVAVLAINVPLMSLATFGAYAASGVELTAQVIVPAIAMLTVLSLPLARVPMLLSRAANAKVSLNRIEDFLRMHERCPAARPEGDTVSEFYSDGDHDDMLVLEDAAFCWGGGEEGAAALGEETGESSTAAGDEEDSNNAFSMEKISLRVKRNELVMIVGPVGSGKSTLLQAILGNVTKISGSCHLRGKRAYCPQQAFISNATVRDNILFGNPFDEERYSFAVRVSSLEHDLSVLESGDQTEIGERGVNLSGGQKQRVSIARAVYHDADVYLFDDPLSAVDAHTGQDIFNNCIAGALHEKTVLMCTNQLQYLEYADRIVVLVNGRISEQGTYEELVDAGLDFAELMQRHGRHSDADTDTASDSDTSETEEEKVLTGKGKTLVAKEERALGSVSWGVVVQFLRDGGLAWCFLILTFAALSATFTVGTAWWMSYWTDHYNVGDDTKTLEFYIGVYGAITAGVLVTVALREVIFVKASKNAVRRMHERLISNVLHFSSAFFDSTPLGRVLNRFSKDVAVADMRVIMFGRFFMFLFLMLFGSTIYACVVTYFLPIVLIPCIAVFYVVYSHFRKSGREFQRMESIFSSPVLAHFSESLHGRATILAYGQHDANLARNQALLDRHHRAYYLARTAPRWLDLRLGAVGSFVILAIALMIFLIPTTFSVTESTIALQQMLASITLIPVLMVMATELEIGLTNVERIQYYGSLPSEKQVVAKKDPPKNWPKTGRLVFSNVVMRYRDGLENALRGVSFSVEHGEKIGVVGRSGAGKSSLVQVILRLFEIQKGKIHLDGQDTKKLSLTAVRRAVFTIPQDPVLFEGTVRFNLDPLEQTDDDELWRLLDLIQLGDRLRSLPDQLDDRVDEGGTNFSVGERQLFCFARALNAKAKVIIMDEATASIDADTDHVIQRVIREQFSDCTVITIAHRINTIIDSDKILVMDAGKVAEFDTPRALMGKKRGVFKDLARDAGINRLSNSDTTAESTTQESSST